MSEKAMKSENVQIVRQLIDEVWSQGKYDVADELVADEYVEHDPALEEDVEGIEAFKENVAGFRETLVGLEKDIKEIVSDGDTVAVHYVFTGTHEEELWETEPTDEEVSATGMFFFHLEDGKITDCTHLWDAYGTLQQMDAIPTEPDW